MRRILDGKFESDDLNKHMAKQCQLFSPKKDKDSLNLYVSLKIGLMVH